MKVILQENIVNLGKVGDMVNVKAGYARNFLLPQSKAVTATESNIIEFEKRRAEFEARAAELLAAANARADQVKELTVTIAAQAGDEGKLFGSVGPRDVAEAAVQAGFELCKSEVQMPEGPLRNVGEYELQVKLHSDVMAPLKVNIIAAS